jgi:hypothetical protein
LDAELRTLERRLVADPADLVAGMALARAIERGQSPPAAIEALPVKLRRGTAVLVVRRACPRAAFAWRAFMDRAIGRVGWVGAASLDDLSVEVNVPEVGRFHAGAASLHPIAEIAPPPTGHELEPIDRAPPALDSDGSSIADLRRLALSALTETPGPLGADGLTAVQRTLLAAVPASAGTTVDEVARAAGFVAENNRSVENALSVLYDMSEQCSRARPPLVTIQAPLFLPGAVVQGPLDTGAWSVTDLSVERLARTDAILEGLPWAVVGGLRLGEIESPPHNAAEVADALVRLLENPRADLDALLSFLPGPDFPGGGEIGDDDAIRVLYETGEGALKLRASIELELPTRIVISSPFSEDALVGLARDVEDAVVAGRLDGVAGCSLNPNAAGPLRVDLDRGGGLEQLLSAKHALVRYLPLEQEVRYRLPKPLIPWLAAFLEARREVGLSDRAIKASVLEARHAFTRIENGERKTRIF